MNCYECGEPTRRLVYPVLCDDCLNGVEPELERGHVVCCQCHRITATPTYRRTLWSSDTRPWCDECGRVGAGA